MDCLFITDTGENYYSKIAKRKRKESDQRRIKSTNELLMEQNVLFLLYHVESVLHRFCTCPLWAGSQHTSPQIHP